MTITAGDAGSTRGSRIALGLTLISVVIALFFDGQQLILYAAACITLLLALACAAWLPRPEGTQLRIGLPGIVLGLLVLWSALAVQWSVVPYLSVFDLAITGSGLVSFLVAKRFLDDADTRKAAAAALTILGIAIAVTMLVQITLGHRPLATFLNPNSAAGFLNLLWPIPAAISLMHTESRRQWIGLLALVALMVFAVAIDGSRAATLAALVVLGVIVVAHRFTGGHQRNAMVLVAVVIGTMALAHVANVIGFGGRSDPVGSRLASIADPEAAGGPRWVIWRATWELVQQAPWLGHGPGTFNQVFPAFREATDSSAGFFVHNDYLQYLAERGAPGLILLLLLAFACARLYLRGFRGTTSRSDTLMMMTAAASLAGAATHAVFSYNLHVLPFVMVFGISIAALDSAAPFGPGLRVNARSLRARLVPVATLAGLLLVGVAHLGLVAASWHYSQSAARHVNAEAYDVASSEYHFARRLWNSADPPWLGQADLYRRVLDRIPEAQMDMRAAAQTSGLHYVDEARLRNPLRADALRIKGELLLHEPGRDSQAAEAAFHQALEMDPREIRARTALARFHLDAGDTQAARRVIEEGLELAYGSPRNTAPLLRMGIQLRLAEGDIEGAEALNRQLLRELDR